MSVVITDDILESARMTPEELKLELAVLLYKLGRFTLAQASRFCGMSRIRFQHVLASREIPVNYDIAELEADLKALEHLAQ